MTATCRKQCVRLNTTGERHFLTFSCFRGQPFLQSDRACGWLETALISACQLHEYDLNGYVLMPDHVHLLVRPRRQIYDISGLLTSIKRPVTHEAKRFITAKDDPDIFLKRFLDVQPNGQAHFRSWQRRGGYDKNIWSADELAEKINHIPTNPVKSKLCSAPEDWKWSSAADYAGTSLGPIPIVPCE